MINVGIDAWHFRPLDDKKIQFITTAMEKFYDQNVFPATPDLKEFQTNMNTLKFKKWPV
jgi:hypothetical protein